MRGRGAGRALGCGAASVLACAVAAAVAAPAPSTVRLTPKARPLSTYLLEARLDLANRDVTFEAPAAYHDKFAFWTGRMKGHKRSEIYEFQTSTQERAADGTVPFKRLLSRFQVEMEREGKPLAAYGSLQKDMASHAWEGVLDPLGNVREIRKVQGIDNSDAAELWMPMIERVFPPLPEAREIAAGKGFSDTVALPLPSRLHIRGLEDVRVLVTRDYLLKDSTSTMARFEVRTTYALDPETPPGDRRTTCAIAGGGIGEASFDLRRGVFLETKLPTRMTIDITAPLQPLEGQPPADAPLRASTRVELDLSIRGRQTVRRFWGEDED